MPGNITPRQAAAVPVAALTALQGLRDKGKIRPGHKVLISGAAGGVGTFAVQIAKSFGAEVTGVCSTRNVGMVQSLGADRVLDYTREDFTASGERYDVFFDLVGNRPLTACRRVVKPDGIYVGAGGPGSRWLLGLIARPAAMLNRKSVGQRAGGGTRRSVSGAGFLRGVAGWRGQVRRRVGG
jgi:NADPH:quinone reductase-like Zn-dependent oxidoreductase